MSWNVETEGRLDTCVREMEDEVTAMSLAYPHEAEFMSMQLRVVHVVAMTLHPAQRTKLFFVGHIDTGGAVYFMMSMSVMPR